MTVFETIAALLTAAALAGYINQRWFRLPTTIALMGFALLLSITGIGLSRLGIMDLRDAVAFVGTINFSNVLLNGMLALLLFAGALQIDLSELHRVRWPVLTLATFGVLISTFVTGGLLWAAASFLGFGLPVTYAFLFGALISPTDPIAIMAILKKAQVSKRLYAGIGGESLLNDGVGVVVFMTMLGIATNSQEFNPIAVASDLTWKMVGGAALGGILGYVASYLIQTVNEYKVEILLTLGFVSGGYVLAGMIETSGPIAIAVLGLVIGSYGKQKGMSAITQKHLYLFWELLDEIMNAILFLLMGLEIVIITITGQHFLMGLIAIPVLLIARFISVGLPIGLTRLFHPMEKGTVRLLTWGSLRGGISIAMALSLPFGAERDTILAMTYIVVVFSILVQGLTFPKLVEVFAHHHKHDAPT